NIIGIAGRARRADIVRRGWLLTSPATNLRELSDCYRRSWHRGSCRSLDRMRDAAAATIIRRLPRFHRDPPAAGAQPLRAPSRYGSTAERYGHRLLRFARLARSDLRQSSGRNLRRAHRDRPNKGDFIDNWMSLIMAMRQTGGIVGRHQVGNVARRWSSPSRF